MDQPPVIPEETLLEQLWQFFLLVCKFNGLLTIANILFFVALILLYRLVFL